MRMNSLKSSVTKVLNDFHAAGHCVLTYAGFSKFGKLLECVRKSFFLQIVDMSV